MTYVIEPWSKRSLCSKLRDYSRLGVLSFDSYVEQVCALLSVAVVEFH